MISITITTTNVMNYNKRYELTSAMEVDEHYRRSRRDTRVVNNDDTNDKVDAQITTIEDIQEAGIY